MTPPIIPSSYDAWKHRITVLCGIPLTPIYNDARIAALGDPADYGTQRCRRTRGEEHLGCVRAWFDQARAELAAGGAA